MSTEYKLSICAIVKDEAPYIEEWIEFHLMQGVEHFYLYDNQSTDGTSEILARYDRMGIVTPSPWFASPPQFSAYEDCLHYHGGNSEWMAFIDVDEFLMTLDGTDLKDFLAPMFGVSVLAVHWMFYGSFYVLDDRYPVTERFCHRSSKPDKHVKSIVRPEFIKSVGNNPHTFRVKSGRIVNELKEDLPEEYAILPSPTAEYIRINHYHTKTKKEYLKRKIKPDPGTGIVPSKERVEEMFKAHNINEQYDLSAVNATTRHNSALKQIIKRVRECSINK